MTRFTQLIGAAVFGVASLGLLALPALAAEPGNVAGPSDSVANDLNAKQAQQIQEEQDRMNKEVEEKNAERMREWQKQNDERIQQWQKEHPVNQPNP